MFDHITVHFLERSSKDPDLFYKENNRIHPIEQVQSTGKRELAGVMNDKFPVLQKDGDGASDFSTATIKVVFVFFAYRTKAE